MYYSFFIHSSVEGHLGAFHVLAVVNSAPMSTGVHVSFQTMFSSGYMPRSGIAGSYDNSLLSFLRSLHTVLHSQFSSVTQSCPTLCDPMDCSTPGLSVHHQLPEFTQTHVHWFSDAILPSSLPAFNLSQHQGLFKWVSSSYQMAKGPEFQLQHQSFQWIFRTDFL